MDMTLDQKVQIYDNLIAACTNLKQLNSQNGRKITSKDTADIVKLLNQIISKKTCVSVDFTYNTDKMFFGVIVSPTITNADLINILIGDSDVNIDRYKLEIDSKLVDELEPEEIAAVILEDASNMTGETAIQNVRDFIDKLMAREDDAIDIRNSINANNLIIFAIKDLMRKLNSVIYKINDSDLVGLNSVATEFNTHDTLIVALEKLKKFVLASDTAVASPDFSLLQWVFLVYKNITTEYKDAVNTLTIARDITGSEICKNEIDVAIKSLRRASVEVVNERAVMLNEVKKLTMLQNIKQKGLRGIEDQLFEYKVRVKNCNSENDAMLTLRQINANLAILEDYLNNSPNISESERERWLSDIDEYRKLRIELGRKKFNKAQYGLFYDYSQLDALDAPRVMNTPYIVNPTNRYNIEIE